MFISLLPESFEVTSPLIKQDSWEEVHWKLPMTLHGRVLGCRTEWTVRELLYVNPAGHSPASSVPLLSEMLTCRALAARHGHEAEEPEG